MLCGVFFFWVRGRSGCDEVFSFGFGYSVGCEMVFVFCFWLNLRESYLLFLERFFGCLVCGRGRRVLSRVIYEAALVFLYGFC